MTAAAPADLLTADTLTAAPVVVDRDSLTAAAEVISHVGPRPERKHYIDLITERVPAYALLHQVRPGITSMGILPYSRSAPGTTLPPSFWLMSCIP